jgi:pimeloyl-ACP methyl ester carboxylesterase
MMQQSRRLAAALVIVGSLLGVSPASARPTDVPGPITVSLPGGGTVQIRIDNFENPNKNGGNKTLLAVHALTHTGASFAPLANELFKQKGNDKVGRVLALNFPGRNGSGLPSNVPFGNLTVEDFTAVLLGVLDQLPKQAKIETIVAHSMGALIAQMAQDSLLSSGTSLQKKYGIKNVYLLTPSIPNPIPWLLADSGAFVQFAQAVIDDDPRLGVHLRLLSEDRAEQEAALGLWLTLFFTNRRGEFVPGTPFTTALPSNYVSNEALLMTLQVLGAAGFRRPFVNRGIFDDRVQKCFRILSFSEDLAVPGENRLQEDQNLADYLTGEGQLGNVVFINAPDAVHDMYIANPAEVARALTSCN